MQDQDSLASTISVTATAVSDTEQKHNLPGATDMVTEMTDQKEPAIADVATQDQQLPDSTDAVTEMIADRKPQAQMTAPGEDLFKSLFAADKSPPNTPGSVSSSATLIGPSSRKVSPLDLGILSKGSPTAVKDFANPSLDSVRVDPVAMTEEETKKGLLKELKKKMASEKKAYRKSEKLVAQTKTLSAELKSAKATLENRDAQADLAKAHGNAMTVSNVVLRQLMKDISHGLRHQSNGTQANGTALEGEAKWGQHKEELLQEHLRGVDESRASAYGRMAILESASVVRGQGLNNTLSQKSVPQENSSPTNELVESKESESSVIQSPAQQASQEAQTDVVASTSFTGASEETQPETTVEASEVPPKEKVGNFFEKYGFDPAEISRIVNSVTPKAHGASDKEVTEEVTQEKEAVQKIEEQEADPMADKAVLTALQEYQQRDPNLGEESAAGPSQAMADPIAADFDDATPEHNDSKESDGEDQVSEADEDTSPSTAEHLNSESAHDEEHVTQEPTTDATRDYDQSQTGTEGHEDDIYGQYEYSEPAGPATLWGILQSDQTEDEANGGADANADALSAIRASVERIGRLVRSGQSETNANDVAETDDDAALASYSEPAGPVTESSQSESEARDSADARDNSSTSPAERPTLRSDHVEDPITQEPITDATRDYDPIQAETEVQEDDIYGRYEFSEPAGPATLWGILQSSQEDITTQDSADVGDATAGVFEAAGPTTQPSLGQHEANDNADAVEEAAGSPDAAGTALSSEFLRSEEVEDTVEEEEVAGDEAVDVSDQEAPGPATLWGILQSEPEPPTNHSNTTGVLENGRMDGEIVPEQSESNDVACAQDQEDKQPCDLPHDTPPPDRDNDTDSLRDNNNNKVEPSHPTHTPTDEKHPVSNHFDSVDDDVIAVEEVTQEVIEEETVGAVGVESPSDTLEAVAHPTEGSKIVEVSEQELDNGATEAIDVHETTISVHANTPVGAAENATAARIEDQEEPAAEEVNAFEVPAAPEELEGSDEEEDTQVVEEIAVTDTSPLRTAMAEEEDVSKEGAMLNGSTVIGNMQATCYEDTDDANMANRSTITTAEGSNADSPVALAQTLSPPSTSSTTPRAISPYHVETFEFFGEVPKPKKVTKTEKRRQERQRAAAKKKEEEALRRHMEEEAAKSPEAIARREAEELRMLGEKRLRLQEARMEAARVADEKARLAQLAGR